MSSFKPGDRVRRIGKDVPGYCVIGDQGTVVDIKMNSAGTAKNVVTVDFDNGSTGFDSLDKYLELVASVQPATTTNFKVGDRVRRIIDRSSGLIPVGEEGIILGIRVNYLDQIVGLDVKFDNAGERTVDSDTVELVLPKVEPIEEAPKTLPNSQPVQAVMFCKKKYYGTRCDCGNCPKTDVMRFN